MQRPRRVASEVRWDIFRVCEPIKKIDARPIPSRFLALNRVSDESYPWSRGIALGRMPTSQEIALVLEIADAGFGRSSRWVGLGLRLRLADRSLRL